MKRAFDFVGAAIGLVLASPLILLFVVLIRRHSDGPGIFSQERVGRGGAQFRCHKLRTMFVGTPNVPSHDAISTQITPIGRKLRRSKLDELPQLWNVLTGEMSFVGPRPCLPSQTLLIEERRKRGVLVLRPGITGLAQINDIDMSDPIRLADKDEQYVRSQSLTGDLEIMFRTIFGGSGGSDRVPH